MTRSVWDDEVFRTVNEVRLNPTALVPELRQRLERFRGNEFKLAENSWLLTKEGPSVVQEAIDALEAQKPLEALEWEDLVAKASKDHVDDSGPKGLIGHDGSDGSRPHDRVQRYLLVGASGENIMYGAQSARDCVISLIVDDGVPGRGHRTNILNPMWTHFGCFTGPHAGFQNMTTMNFIQSKQEAEKEMRAASESLSSEIQEPEGWIGKQVATSQAYKNDKLVTTMTITYQFPDGSKKVITKTSETQS